MVWLLYMTQRWGHHSAEGNKSSSITPMKVVYTEIFVSGSNVSFCVLVCVLVWDLWELYLFQHWASEKERHEKPHDVHKCKYTIRVIIVSERWEKCNVGFPLLWLGTLRRISHVHMYTFPATIHQKPFMQPGPFILCSACRAQEFTFVNCRWYLGFWLRRYSFLNHGSFSFLDRGLCDMSSIEVLNTVWSQLSIKIYHNNIVKRRIDAKNWAQTDSRLKYCSIYTLRMQNASLCPWFSLLPCYRNMGAPGLLQQQSAGLTANTALCRSVHWLSYLPIYHSWIGTSLAWNLLSDLVRVTWDAWCCNCSALGNGGSIANVFRVILTYLVCFIL